MKTIADVIAKSRKEFLFNNFYPDENITYCVRIKDFLSSKLIYDERYFLFECEAMEQIPNLLIEKNEWFMLHFPMKSFMIAFDKTPIRKQLMKGDNIELMLMFRRLTKKKIEFVKLEIIRKDGDN